MAGDAVSVVPDLYKVLLENDRVRVLDTRYGPGVKSALHSHPDLVVVAVSSLKATLTFAGGQAVEMDLSSGDATFVEAQEHTVENTANSELHVILVELK